MHGGFYPGFETTKPPFELPVVYEDDHFAIVNKPAGIVCYSQRKQSHGMMTVRAALPFALQPPKRGTLAIIRRPASVHRLDKPTSGLLLVAKTKPAMVDLTRQFVERVVKKTYTAILNGIPSEPVETSISVDEALDLGVDVNKTEDCKWQLIDHTLDEKSAVTVWKPIKYVKSLKAKDGILTLVEMKPKTGRYHQLRRHMSWVKDCAIVGDNTYDGGGKAMSLRGRGLFLCSNKVSLHHPYYNTVEGRAVWDKLGEKEKWANGTLRLSEDGSTVEVHASIDLPNKFYSFLSKEEERQEKLGDEDP
jgi:23S rRNA-/tRNA-specific pseudouridylate synthase